MTDLAFVSMPFGDKPDSPENEWTKLYDFGLKPLEQDLETSSSGIRHIPIKLWRADRNQASLTLKNNVMRAIEESTFILCVLTTGVVDGTSGLRLSNPNVLWELGFSQALGKPAVIMADNDSLRSLPVLAGLPNVFVYPHDVVKEIPSKNAPTALKFIAQGLVEHAALACKEAKGGPKRGIRSQAIVFPGRDSTDLAKKISYATQQVDILTTNLNYFSCDSFDTDPHPIQMALENGATVRIVTLNPESVIAEYRAEQLIRGEDIPGYRRELRDGIIYLYKRFRNYQHFHLHIYNDLPLQITTRIDQTIVTSVLTRGEKARKRIQIQFDLYDEGVTESFVGHFQSMFDTSKDIGGIKWVTRYEK